MPNLSARAFVITLGLIGPTMAQERILISSDWGKVTAELADNDAGPREVSDLSPPRPECTSQSCVIPSSFSTPPARLAVA
jgi:hypothetical protein